MPVFETWLLHQNQAQRAARTCEKRAVLTVLPSSTASFMSTFLGFDQVFDSIARSTLLLWRLTSLRFYLER